jgi:hypothetical protein
MRGKFGAEVGAGGGFVVDEEGLRHGRNQELSAGNSRSVTTTQPPVEAMSSRCWRG